MKVQIIMGSASDAGKMEPCAEALKKIGVSYRGTVASAHRTPQRVRSVVREAENDGAQVFVCAAGHAAHLAGAVAALTARPVIGVPISSSALDGMDSLLSTVQMPPGVPVATVGIDGARNAAMLAARIIALSDEAVLSGLLDEIERQAQSAVKSAGTLPSDW